MTKKNNENELPELPYAVRYILRTVLDNAVPKMLDGEASYRSEVPIWLEKNEKADVAKFLGRYV